MEENNKVVGESEINKEEGMESETRYGYMMQNAESAEECRWE